MADSTGVVKGFPSAVGLEDTFCSSAASLGLTISRHLWFLGVLCIWSFAISGLWQFERLGSLSVLWSSSDGTQASPGWCLLPVEAAAV